MAAKSTGSDWRFPDDLPGDWPKSNDDTAENKEAWTHKKEDLDGTYTTEPLPEQPTPERPSTDRTPKRERRRVHYPPRQCRICLEVVLPVFHTEESSFPLSAFASSEPRVTYSSPDEGRLLRPCKCKGSQKYVHEGCLMAWRLQDPLQKRNYWECPTCRYRYRLQRLAWSKWIGSTMSQIGLTLLIFIAAMFLLGFVADPIINMYIDPVETIASGGGPTGSLFALDEPASWSEHFAKGLATLGLLGFAKFFLAMGPWQWFQTRGLWGIGRGTGGTGRDRLQQISLITILIGVFTFLYAVWKGVRAFCRRTLEKAGDSVMDVPEADDDDDD